MQMEGVLAVVLAGGKGLRLEPLTRDRAKPAVPFGGAYRIIDFTLSNCLNSGMRKMLVLTQYKAMSLDRHIHIAWRRFLCHELGEFIDVVPPQQRIDEHWYQGTADAVYQNIYALEKERPEYVVILAGDHIYKMNYETLLDFHRDNNADVTVGALRVDASAAAYQFGVMEVDEQWRIIGFEEKPARPKTIPGEPGKSLASMGIYVFSARFLFEQLCLDATRNESQHDFGRNIIPAALGSLKVFAYPFTDTNTRVQHYWRDVGTVDAFYEANMELIHVNPELNIYDEDWPIWTYQRQYPPAKFVLDEEGRRGMAVNSMVSGGCIISGAHVNQSLLFSNVRVDERSYLERAVIFPDVRVGAGSVIKRAIVDTGAEVPPDTHIGVNPEEDARRFYMSEGGVALVTRDMAARLIKKG